MWDRGGNVEMGETTGGDQVLGWVERTQPGTPQNKTTEA